MSIKKMRDAKEGKFFYRNSFRRTVFLLITSLILNALLVIGIYFQLINKVHPNYYATSGVKPPIQLTPLSHPNYKSKPLLPPDPITDSNEKMLTK
jgi:intracellular multiplication protein IcmM